MSRLLLLLLATAGLTLSWAASASAYMASPATPLSVASFGANPAPAGDDTASFTQAMRAAALAGTPSHPSVLVVPPGTYRLANLQWRSNVTMIASPRAVFEPFGSSPGSSTTIMTMGAKPTSNVRFQSSDGGYVTFIIDQQKTGGSNHDKAIALRNVSGFSVSDVRVVMNDSQPAGTAPTQTSSGIRFAPHTALPPRYGKLTHVKGVNAPYGFSPVEVGAGHDLSFHDISGTGGITLRVELEADVSGLTISGVHGVNCHAALSYTAHTYTLTNAHATGITARSCQDGVIVRRPPGGRITGSSIAGVSVVKGRRAQLLVGQIPGSARWRVGSSADCVLDTDPAVPVTGVTCR